MSEVNNEMQEIFKKYQDAGNVPAGGLSSAQLTTSVKLKAALEIIKLAEKNLRAQGFRLFSECDVKIAYTFNDNKGLDRKLVNAFSAKFSENKKNLSVAINFNASYLAQLGAEEVYGVAYAYLYNSLVKKREKDFSESEVKLQKEDDLEQDLQETTSEANFNGETDVSKQRHPIKEFFVQILKLILGEDFNSLESEDVSKLIETNLAKNGITSEEFFENPNGKNLLAERYGKVVKNGYLQQSTFLLGVISKNEFNALKTGNDAEIKDFCVKYVNCILANSNIGKNVEVKFESGKYLGEYNDYGNRQEICIDIERIKKKNNPAEVVMTLQHELTHAIDSSYNKSRGVTEDGYGLVDNLVGGAKENINKVHAKNDANQQLVRDYFVRLQKICYDVNPNECSARMGELAAVKFMQGLHSDKTMQKYIDKSIKAYVSHQENVLESIGKIDEIIHEFETVKKLGDLQTNDLIRERIEYLLRLREEGKINEESIKKSMEIALGQENMSSELQEESGYERENI